MEDLAHFKILNGTYIPTKDERFQVLKNLDDEVRYLNRTYVRRRGVGEVTTMETLDPEGYIRLRDERLMWFVDRIFVPGCCAEYLEIVKGLIRTRDQLRTYISRRVGRPENRYQNPKEWNNWSRGRSLPSICGFERGSARRHFQEGLDYENTLYDVAGQWMMVNGQIDRRHAVALKKSVDRAYFDIHGEKPPLTPRGWWHPDPDLGITPGGLQEIGLAWAPSYNSDLQSSEPTIPYHVRVSWTLEYSCWKDVADQWF